MFPEIQSRRLSHMNCRMARSLAILSAMVAYAAVQAEPVNDPIPERIAKGDVRIELKPIASGLASPLLVVQSPDRPERLVVVDQPGKLRVCKQGLQSCSDLLGDFLNRIRRG